MRHRYRRTEQPPAGQPPAGQPLVITGEMWNTNPAYEYQAVVMTGQGHFDEVLAQLNEMGAQGWHVVAVDGNNIFMERAKLEAWGAET